MGKSKFYTVWKGRTPGVYSSWDDCREQVTNFDGALYRSYESESEARRAFNAGLKGFSPKRKDLPQPTLYNERPVMDSVSVDAACSGNPGIMEYQGVETHSKIRIFHGGPFRAGTNNVGEFLAIVHALALLKKNNIKLPIYSDSNTAMKWVKDKKAKTKLVEVAENEELFDLIYRAEIWLKENSFENQLLKWDTKSWGEIPADFGRK